MIDYVFLPAPRTPQRKSLQFGGCRIDFRLRLLSTYRANKKTFFVGFHCNCLLLAVYYFFTGKFPIGEWPVFRYPPYGVVLWVCCIYLRVRCRRPPFFRLPGGGCLVISPTNRTIWPARAAAHRPSGTSPCGPCIYIIMATSPPVTHSQSIIALKIKNTQY